MQYFRVYKYTTGGAELKMNVEDQKSLIGNVVAFTLALIALIFIIFCAVLSVFFPKIYGDVLFSVGLRNVSLSAYEYNYKITNDINDLYLLVTKSIQAKNDEYIVKSYETLERQDIYFDFVAYVETAHLNNCASTLEMLYLSNEDNYLKGKYTLALKSFKSDKDAFDYAYANMVNANITSSSDRINFVLGYYINTLGEADDFSLITTDVKNDIFSYFDSLYTIYTSELNALVVPDNEYYLINKFNLLKLNYRHSDICFAMKQIDKAVSMERDMTAIDSAIEKLMKDFPSLL